MPAIRCVKVEPNKNPVLVDISVNILKTNFLKKVGKEIGAEYVERIATPFRSGGYTVYILVDEEGKLKRKPICRPLEITGSFDFIVGTAIIAAVKGDNFVSMPDDIANYWLQAWSFR